MSEHGFTREGDTVVLRMSQDDFEVLLMALGFAITHGGGFDWSLIELLNRMNSGNPNFRPYAVPVEGEPL
jgi:hypothetical protein